MGADFLAFFAMVFVQLGYAGMNIISTLAMDSGMNPYVHVAYRQLFATVSLAPFAFFLERKAWSLLTCRIICQIFLCSIFGATVNQLTYFLGLKYSTPTIACALTNLIPAITYLMAWPLGYESAGLRTRTGQAKTLGTLICVGGAVFLAIYHGPSVGRESSFHWQFADKMKSGGTHGKTVLGSILLIISSISWAIWLIIQSKVGKVFPAGYTSSALMCFMASIQCVIISFCVDPHVSAWSLSRPIRLVSSVYAGIVCTAMAFCLSSWCVARRGPLYVSVFSPLLLVIVAALSWALLQEQLHVGTLVGSGLIVMGLYCVLWGKNREMKLEEEVKPEEEESRNEEMKTVKDGAGVELYIV